MNFEKIIYPDLLWLYLLEWCDS